MSAAAPATPAEHPPGTAGCARCGAAVGPDQDWCLECGFAARTRVAATPRWWVPLALAAAVAAIALGALAVAFVDLTEDPETTVTVPATSTAPPAATTPPATPPAATAPPATPAPPARTTPNPTATAPAAPDAPGGTGGAAAP